MLNPGFTGSVVLCQWVFTNITCWASDCCRSFSRVFFLLVLERIGLNRKWGQLAQCWSNEGCDACQSSRHSKCWRFETRGLSWLNTLQLVWRFADFACYIYG